MATVLPYVPSYITVHLGAPSQDAANVTVSFTDYVKNVASSEVYPTWDADALRANILAITSFALNRVYTEYYRTRGYPFDITSSTAYDQQFVNGRNYFANVSRLVDELYDDYIRRVGFIEPLAAKFCNGTTVTCSGMSQWGSQELAEQGNGWLQILKYYYGNDIEIVNNAPKLNSQSSYPGIALRLGSRGQSVVLIQRALNRISRNFPAIPKLQADGIYGPATQNAVTAFQQAFGLDPDGVVGRITWYAIERIFGGVLRLSELYSEGLRYEDLFWENAEVYRVGDRGEKVSQLQYMLSVVAQFISSVPSIEVDGIFGPNTRGAVLAFQRWRGLPQTGEVDENTWDAIFDRFAGIENTVFEGSEMMLPDAGPTTALNVRARLEALGYSGPNLQQELISFQAANGLPRSGRLTEVTAARITSQYEALRYSQTAGVTQYPGYALKTGSTDAGRQGG